MVSFRCRAKSAPSFGSRWYINSSGKGESTCLSVPWPAISAARLGASQQTSRTVRYSRPLIMIVERSSSSMCMEGKASPDARSGRTGKSFGTMWVCMSIIIGSLPLRLARVT